MKTIIKVILLAIVFFYVISLLRLSLVESFVFWSSLLLLFQGAMASFGMIYSFLKPENLHKVMPPRVLIGGGSRKYTLLVPAKNEEKVIADTLRATTRINYPKDLYEVIVIVRNDDFQTKETIVETMKEIMMAEDRGQKTENGKTNIRLIEIAGEPINKPYSLNIGLSYATGEIISVFDAEDQPHPDILTSIDEVFSTKKVDIVQAGVQLVNVSSAWFSALNCLEYYYWFKSILPFMSSLGATPLGGNTVFFKRNVLEKLGGWDENCLTEDADIGVRASVVGFKTSMVYLEEIATIEETPINESNFIKQRTRWDQGYMQILAKGDWLRLPTLRQKFLSFFLLMQPIIHHFTVIYMLSIPLIAWGLKVQVWLALFSWFPFYFLVIQFGLYFIGLSDLKKHYKLNFSNTIYIKLFLFFIPYQVILSISTMRALSRIFLGIVNWEKTSHVNIHRLLLKKSMN